jgi:hypothetical protein
VWCGGGGLVGSKGVGEVNVFPAVIGTYATVVGNGSDFGRRR